MVPDTPPITLITPPELDFFKTNGYLKLNQVIPKDLLLRLRQLFHQLIFEAGDNRERTSYRIDDRLFVSNLENLCNKGDLCCLELLGSPFILEIAETICGPDFFPVQDFAVVKMLGDTNTVLWHQDMLNQRSAPSFTMGIYLDDANENDGALRVIPGSHIAGKSICDYKKEPFTEIPARAGDILIHDMLLAHSSEAMTKNELRRVIYFEFLAEELVVKEEIYGEDLIARRTELLAAALQFYRQQHPGSCSYPWKNHRASQFSPVTGLHAWLSSIYEKPVQARPSAYCFEHKAGEVVIP